MLRDRTDIMDHIRKWAGDITFCTEPVDRKISERKITKLYNYFHRAEPVFLWFESLPAAEFAYCLILNQEPHWFLSRHINTNLYKFDENIPDSFWESLENSMQPIDLSSFTQKRKYVDYFPVSDVFTSPLDKGVPIDILMISAKMSDEIYCPDNLPMPSQFAPICPTLMWAGTPHHSLAGYWVETICYLEENENIAGTYPANTRTLHDLDRSCFLWFPFDTFVLAVERPLSVKHKNWRIHCEDGPAVVWRDGVKSWLTNGVSMKKEYIQTAANNIPASVLLKEDNVAVRCELVKKIGMKQICEELGVRTIDRLDEYELILLDCSFPGEEEKRYRPYLKMINASTGEVHIEGVPPETTTVLEALSFRNGMDSSPIIIT